LRLLELPQMLRNALLEGLITEGHARALLGLADRTQQEELGKRVVQEKLTVRDVEKLVLDWASAARTGRVKTPRRKNADVRHLEEDLQRTLSRRVVIDARAKNKGWVRLEFYSLDDLDSLVARLKTARTRHDRPLRRRRPVPSGLGLRRAGPPAGPQIFPRRPPAPPVKTPAPPAKPGPPGRETRPRADGAAAGTARAGGAVADGSPFPALRPGEFGRLPFFRQRRF
jgi:hypothetical protein